MSHDVTISWNNKSRSWDIECSGCACKLKDFGSDGLAEQAADRYHENHRTKIDSFKYPR